MPFVRSYFRRSQGAAAAGREKHLPASERINVAVYDATGQMVRDASGGRWQTRGLSFSTAIPGGFLQASFQIAAPTARLWRLTAGQRLVLRRGRDVVWWGWIEDISSTMQPETTMLTVTALGPWQLFQQRRVTQTYAGMISTYALRDVMRLVMPELSIDASQMVNSERAITRVYTNEQAAVIAKAVCELGDSSGRPLLFAIWEPAEHNSLVEQSANLLWDGELEQTDTYWIRGGSDIYFQWSAGTYISPQYGLRMAEYATGGITQRNRVAVAAGSTYVMEYWLKWSAFAGMTCEGRVDWYNSSNNLISSTYTPQQTSDGITTTWRRINASVTAPAGAVEAVVGVGGAVGGGGGSARSQWIDDVKFYQQLTQVVPDARPRGRLWARDMNGWDYLLWTARLTNGLQSTASTRQLANRVTASYGSLYTTPAEDATSQGLYRRRDYLLKTTSGTGQADAETMRDVYLATYAEPRCEAATFAAQRGTITTATGRAVDLARVRAGERLRIADGPQAGRVLLLERTTWRDGVLTCQPEQQADVPLLLARGG